MKKITLGIGLLIVASVGISAQKTKNASVSGSSTSSTSASVTKAGMIQTGTRITGQLQSTLDAKTANVGDEVVLRTTSAIKQDGKVVVPEGSKLIGRVTDVTQRAKNVSGSKIGVLFDTLQQGDRTVPISAVITSITQSRVNASRAADDSLMTSGSTMSTTSASSGTTSSGSGLLGGVTSTVGGALNTTTQTVGGVTDTAGQTIGATTRTAGSTLSGLQISQSADASANGASTLSLSNGNLRLDKGTTFNLRVSEASTTRAN
jgi:hypothetical protein